MIQILIGTFIATYFLADVVLLRVMRASNSFQAFMLAVGVTLIVWGIIG